MSQEAAVISARSWSDCPGEVASVPLPRTVPIEFRANGAEYFRIWIVNLLFTILTLGVYSAWAKVRRLRYFYGSTSVDGSAFEYHGRPLQILKGRLIAVGLFGVYWLAGRLPPMLALALLLALLAVFPLIVVRSRIFQMRMTSWRSVHFDFRGTYGGAAANFLGFPFLTAVTFGLAGPLMLWARAEFIVENTRFGDLWFRFVTRVRSFYRVVVLTVLLVVGMLSAGIAVVARAQGESGATGSALLVLGACVLVAAPLIVCAFGESSYKNLVYGAIRFGDNRLNCRLRMRRLVWLYLTNIAGLLVTFGFFYPWAVVRRLKYQLESMSLELREDLDTVAAGAQSEVGATGDELGEILGLDFGL